MPKYTITAADRRPLPASYGKEERRIGFSQEEMRRPFAHYFQANVRPVQPAVRQALENGRLPCSQGYEIDHVAKRLSKPGYDGGEIGWTVTERGTLFVSCLTDMPSVTSEMWDWWVGWHARDSARYKLWHPEAHVYCAIGEDRSESRHLSDRQRYIDNVAYVDEYVGRTLQRLAIRFIDPARFGFRSVLGSTYICGRVGSSEIPIGAGWLVHQVRPTESGCEMRSRFFIGHPEVQDLPPATSSKSFAAKVLTTSVGKKLLAPLIDARVRKGINDQAGRDLLHHCASEMNHLAQFLPRLYMEFREVP